MFTTEFEVGCVVMLRNGRLAVIHAITPRGRAVVKLGDAGPFLRVDLVPPLRIASRTEIIARARNGAQP